MRAVLPLWLLFFLLSAGFDWSGEIVVLGRSLRDPDPQARLAAIQKLADFDAGEARKLLLPMLDDVDESVRLEAARVLGRKRVAEAVPRVSEWLAAGEKQVRVAAADVLGDIGDVSATQALTRVLSDSESEVRRAAVDALGRIGGEAAVVPLIGRLDDENMQVRREAAERLMHLGDPLAVIPLVERFVDSAKEVRIAAIRAVGRLGDERAVPALLRLLRDPLEEVRVSAAEALGNLEATAATDDLIPLLGRGSDEFRVKVAYALGKIGDERAVRELVRALGVEALRGAAREALQAVGAAAVPALVSCLEGGLDGCDAAAAVIVLRQAGDARATPALLAELGRPRARRESVVAALGAIGDERALVPLLALLEDSSLELRVQVLEAIAPIMDGRAGDVLARLLDDRSPEVRRRATGYLGALRARRALERILVLAQKDPVPAVAEQAIWAAGEIGDARATPVLIALLREGRAGAQRAAADALGRLRDPASIPALTTVARTPGDPARADALWALGGVTRGRKDEAVRALLEDAARAPDTALALSAIHALAAQRDRASLPVVRKLAGGASRELRRAALETLGAYGDLSVVPLLVEALADDDDAVRAAAAWSLARLGGPPAAREALEKLVRGPGFATAVNATAALAARPARTTLEPLLDDGNPYVRANAALGLAGLGAGDGVRELLVARLGGEEHAYARAALARGLARLGGAEVVLAELAARDPAPEVRRAATETPTVTGDPRDSFIRVIATDEGAEEIARHVLYVLALPRGLLKAGYTDLLGEVREEQVAQGRGDIEWIRQSQLGRVERAPPRGGKMSSP